jgi:hypothetical protein
MRSEILDNFYYNLQRRGSYYVIDKVEKGDSPTETRSTGMAKGRITAQYLFPMNHSFVQSIVNEVLIPNDETGGTDEFKDASTDGFEAVLNSEVEYVFGLLLVNSLSKGSFVFSSSGLEKGIYINAESGGIFSYPELLDFFLLGGRIPADLSEGVKA